MKFNLFKRLFKKENKTQNESSAVATLDTSLIKVPKFSELNDESKEKVLSLLSGLNYDNYESLLKYSDDLLTKSDNEREILINTMDRYEKVFTRISNYQEEYNKLPSTIINVMISGLEYRMILQDILETRKELELRLIALDMFIKKESKRKLDFLGVFGRADRMKYLNNQTRLYNELERLRTMIKTNDNIMDAVSREIYAARNIRKEFEIQGRDSRLENRIRDELSLYLYAEPHYSLPTRNTMWDYWDAMVEVVKRMEGYEDVKGKIIDAKRIENYIDEATNWGEDNSWDNVIREMPREFIDVIYYESAKCYHNLELYKFEHKDDYKIYYEELNKIIKDIESKPTSEWDRKQLDAIISKYCKEIPEYCSICKKYINHDIRKMLFYSVINLMFFRNILNKSNDGWYRRREEEDFWDYFDGLCGNNARDDAQKYCLAKAWDLLRKAEDKYGVEATEMRKLLAKSECKGIDDLEDTYDDEMIYRKLRNEHIYNLEFEEMLFGYLSLLHDLDIGKKDSIKIMYANRSPDFYYYTRHQDKYYRLYVDYIENQSLEEVLYTLRFADENYGDIEGKIFSLGLETVPKEYGIDESPMLIFIRDIYKKDIENQYDERIKVLTKAVQLNESPYENHSSIVIDDDHYMRDLKEIRTTSRTEALYLTRPEQFVEIIRRSNDDSNLKYLMLEDDTLNEGIKEYLIRRVGEENLTKIKNHEKVKEEVTALYDKSMKVVNGLLDGNRKLKVVVVPKLEHYSELSEYLNEVKFPLMYPNSKVKVKERKLIER